MRNSLPRISLLALLTCLSVFRLPLPSSHAQDQPDPVAQMMVRMTPQEKVGQLFIVAFWGRNPSPESRAGLLIQQYKIGGVVLLASNANLLNTGPDTPVEVAALSSALQRMALDEARGSGIPLFVAIDHEGDGYPYTRITGGVTPLPNPMAIGATWNRSYAEQVGEIVGRELAAVGVNMLLGPVVDVLDDPRPGGPGDAGTRIFGGDPYWVGEMGRAYIQGVHAAGQGKMLTVAKHFPGHGGSDRLPDDEVATVDKSLQELKRVELAPFFAVTQPKDSLGLDRTDAMMSSHIRYRGFYGDIRQFTRPISFDAEGMAAILRLPEFRDWREEGLIVSDSLGVPAVRKYFDPQLQTFPYRQIAREAFLAGNDLLILSQFALASDWVQQYENIVNVLEYFRQLYETDPAFAARVDDALIRILKAKLELYPATITPGGEILFPLDEVLVTPEETGMLGQGGALVDQIARQAVTVLHPTADALPRPPRRDEDILIFAEERLIQECYDAIPECGPRPLILPRALEEAILRLYGPQGTDQVDPARITTRTYAQLKSHLARQPGEDDVAALLQGAEWIVLTLLDPNPRYPNSDALQLFLAQNAQQIYNAQVIVLAYTAPYYLDTTEISKLSAYYIFYSKTQPFIDVSARTLFGEVRPQGKSPVSIEGTNYDLSSQLAPDPAQELRLDLLEPSEPSGIVPLTVRVRTSPIRDRNGNPVPDGTQVRFTARAEDSGQTVDTAASPTVEGRAEAMLILDQPGRVLLTASSGEAQEGRPLPVRVLREPTPTPPPATPTPPPPSPTPTPTATPEPTPTSTSTPTLTPTLTPTTTPSPTPSPQVGATPTARGRRLSGSPTWRLLDAWAGQPLDLMGLLAGFVLAAATGVTLYREGSGQPAGHLRTDVRSHRVRRALLAWIGSLAGYMAYGWDWVPIGRWLTWPTWVDVGLLAFVGGLAFVLFFSAGSGRGRAR